MIANVPLYVSLIFGLTTILTWLLFYWTICNSSSSETRKKTPYILIGLILWLAVQAFLTIKNTYNTETNHFPPKVIILGILPAMISIILIFTSKKGRAFVDSLPLKNLTYINIVRIPVEVVLYWLFIYHTIPKLMTFEGRNFDIVAGITAPFVAYYGIVKQKMNKKMLLIWNLICLGLLLNIVVNALLSSPSPIQTFAFDQPNIAILNFPFSWLQTFIVPLVLFGHLASIRQLVKN